MKRHAVVAPRAAEDLETIADFIAERSPTAARRFLRKIKSTFELLARFPMLGAKWKDSPVPDLRHWPLPRYTSYVIFYRPIANGVEIVRIVRGARDFSKLF